MKIIDKLCKISQVQTKNNTRIMYKHYRKRRKKIFNLILNIFICGTSKSVIFFDVFYRLFLFKAYNIFHNTMN